MSCSHLRNAFVNDFVFCMLCLIYLYSGLCVLWREEFEHLHLALQVVKQIKQVQLIIYHVNCLWHTKWATECFQQRERQKSVSHSKAELSMSRWNSAQFVWSDVELCPRLLLRMLSKRVNLSQSVLAVLFS